MNPISDSMEAARLLHDATAQTGSVPSADDEPVREAFQDFVAGTFYKQMLKSLRQTHDKPAYFHGGSAEDIFQSQLDQQVAEDLARDDGAAFSEPLFTSFMQQMGARQIKPASPPMETAPVAVSE